MGEIKSVKVDNWGVFFLQKLQNFFNKTDYCDLTLQFRDNSQLKVHRLVLSACTDYFNVLEQTCEVIDDALIMPNELQADVVVPIVNFMYTGTLEFELKMYGKLLRTAKEMNMTVLLKLLEAHRRTMENANRQQRPPSPKAIRRRHPIATQTTILPAYQNQGAQVRRVLTTNVAGGVGGNTNTAQRRIVQTKIAGTTVTPVQMQYRQQIGSTSVVRTSTLRGNNPMQQQLQTYIKNEPEEYETFGGNQPQSSSSPFEQLRKGYNNNKRPAVSTFLSPPAKKPNLEDVKEFAEQQRMRKQIAAEYGEDQEFEGMMDDDIRNDDDDDDGLMGNPAQSSTMNTATATTAGTNFGGAIMQAGDGAAATITFKHETDGQPPTIIVKDNSGSKMDHAKIISEVLRQYPQLAKGNRNIKLKIMPTGQGQAQRIIIKKEGAGETQQAANTQQPQQAIKQLSQKPLQSVMRAAPSHIITKTGERVALQQVQAEVNAAKPTVTVTQQTLITPATNVNPAIGTAVAAGTENPQQKRRIDSKTMHHLISLGAENMTGPWLCLRCGVNGRPISIPTYRGFRRHLINTHKETIDPALCEHCGWRSQNNRELHFHIQIEHKIKTTLYTFPECLLCTELFLDTNQLNQHMIDSHPSADKQQCIYCNKIFMKDAQLYTHLKLYHKHQAVEDGIIDASEEEYAGSQTGDENEGIEEHLENEQQEDELSLSKDKKVKILSDISLPMTSSIIKLDGNTLTADSNIINAQTKFVTADGNEMLLTEEQRKEIMSQLNQEHNNAGGVVMVLNDAIFTGTDGGGNDADATAETSTEHVTNDEELDDSQIYTELASEKNETEKQQLQQQHDEAKETAESLEWAENLISEHELAETENGAAKIEEDKAKKELISKKLKELTVDWSEDENDEDDEDLDKSGETGTSETNKIEEKIQEEIASQEEENITAEAEKQIDEQDINKDEITDSQDESMKEENSINSEIKEHEDQEQEPDELDLAMQNLHAEEGNSESETEKIATTAKELKVENENEKMDIDENLNEKDDNTDIKNTEQAETENQENSLNTTLLDELMSVTAATTEQQEQQTADMAEIEKALNEETKDDNIKTESDELNKSNTEDDLDAFAKAGLNDIEEFSAIEKNVETTAEEEQEEEEEATVSTASKEKIAINDEKEQEKETSEKTVALDKEKTLSSDWEDIGNEDDDGGIENEQEA